MEPCCCYCSPIFISFFYYSTYNFQCRFLFVAPFALLCCKCFVLLFLLFSYTILSSSSLQPQLCRYVLLWVSYGNIHLFWFFVVCRVQFQLLFSSSLQPLSFCVMRIFFGSFLLCCWFVYIFEMKFLLCYQFFLYIFFSINFIQCWWWTID